MNCSKVVEVAMAPSTLILPVLWPKTCDRPICSGARLKTRHEPLLWVNPAGAREHLQSAQLSRATAAQCSAAVHCAALESGSTSRFSLRSSCDGSFTWSVASSS